MGVALHLENHSFRRVEHVDKREETILALNRVIEQRQGQAFRAKEFEHLSLENATRGCDVGVAQGDALTQQAHAC